MPQSIPPGLTQEHVLRTLADLDGGIDHPFGQPTGFCEILIPLHLLNRGSRSMKKKPHRRSTLRSGLQLKRQQRQVDATNGQMQSRSTHSPETKSEKDTIAGDNGQRRTVPDLKHPTSEEMMRARAHLPSGQRPAIKPGIAAKPVTNAAHSKKGISDAVATAFRKAMSSKLGRDPNISKKHFQELLKQSFSKNFLEACTTCLRTSPPSDASLARGRWLLNLPNGTSLNAKTIEDSFQVLSDRIVAYERKERNEREEARRTRTEREFEAQEAAKLRIREQKVSFAVSLKAYGMNQLVRMKSKPNLEWMQEMIEGRIHEFETEFLNSIQHLTVAELRAFDTSIRLSWQKRLLSHRIQEVDTQNRRQERREFRWSLSDMNLTTLQKQLNAFPDGWRNEEIVRQIDEIKLQSEDRRREQVEAFRDGLRSTGTNELEQLLQTKLPKWKLDEISSRLNELKSQECAKEIERLKSEVSELEVEALIKIARVTLDGLLQRVVCQRLQEMLPNLASSVVEELSNRHEDGLQVVANRAKAELKLRREASDPVRPKVKKGWV